MSTTAKFGIQIDANTAALSTLHAQLAKVPEILKSWNSALTSFAPAVEASVNRSIQMEAKLASAKVEQTEKVKKAIGEQLTAEDALTKAQQANATKREHLSKLEFEELEHELDAVKHKKQDAETAMTLAVDKESKARLALVKKEAADELKLLNDEYKKRPEVAHEGKGAEHGVLGIGREVIGMGSGGAMLGGLAAAGGASAAAMMLIEHGKEAAERTEELKIGLMAAGKSAEQAEEELKGVSESSHNVAQSMALSTKDVETATAAYLKMGGTTDNLAQKQEVIMALANKAGISGEQAAKMYAKATDDESGSMSRLGIVLDKNNTVAQNQALIAEKLKGNIAGMKDAADGPLGSFKKLQDMMETLMDTFSELIFGALGPVFKIVSEIGQAIEAILAPAFELVGGILSVIGGAISGVFDGIMAVVKPLITEIKAFVSSLLPAQEHTTSIAEIVKNYVTPAFKVVGEVIGFAATWMIHLYLEVAKLYKWVLDVTGVTGFLKAVWNEIVKEFQHAVAVITDVVGAVTSVVSSITDFLGITDKASHKTKELSEAQKEQAEQAKQAGEATKEAAEKAEAAQAALAKQVDETTARLKKQNDDVLSAEKENVDKSAQLIEFYQKRLADPTLTADKRKIFEENLAQQVAYSKQTIGAIKDEEDARKAAHDAQYGTKKPKKKKAKSVSHKDEYNELKDRLEKEAEAQREQAEETATSEKSLKQRLLEIQLDHDQKLLQGTKEFNAAHEKEAKSLAGMEHKIWQDSHAIKIAGQDEELRQQKLRSTQELEAFQLSGVQKNLTQKQIQQGSYEIQLRALNDQLALEKKFGRDSEATQQAISNLNRTHEIDGLKQTQAIAKELRTSEQSQRITEMKSELAQMKALQSQGVNNARDIAQQEDAIAIEEENQRYARELKDRQDELTNTKLGYALKQSLEANHQGKMRAIVQDSLDKQQAAQRKQVEYMAGPLTAGFSTALGSMNKWIDHGTTSWFNQKTAAGQALESIKKATVSMIEESALKAAGAALTNLAIQTATNLGILATAAPAAAATSIASFGSSAIVGQAAVASVLPDMVGMFLHAHADGTDFAPGGWSLVGERGPEIMNVDRGAQIIPNHRLVNVGGQSDNSDMVHELRAQNSLMRQQVSTLNKIHQGGGEHYGSMASGFNQIRGQQASLNAMTRRQVK